MALWQPNVQILSQLARPARVPRTAGRAADQISASITQSAESPATSTDRTRPFRICFFGMFGGGNYGNDGSLEALLLMVRRLRPDAELSCVCVDPDLIRRQHQISTVPISAPGFSNAFLRACDRVSLRTLGRLINWVRAIRYVRRLDIIIVPGTSTLCDFISGPFGTPYGLFRWAAAARLCGVKFCFVGTGAGPIQRDLSRWMLRCSASWAHYRSFRDQVSKDFVTGLGINTSDDLVHPDIVFTLPVRQIPISRAAMTCPTTIAVGVMYYNGWQPQADSGIYEAYLVKMANFVTSLLDRGYRVRLLTGETADRTAVADICKITATKGYHPKDHAPPVANAGQLITERTASLHDLMPQINDTDIVIATRFHNVVCALKLAKPTISIGYEAKNEALMADFGLSRFNQFIEHLDVKQLELQAAELLANKPFWAEHIRKRLEVTQLRVKELEGTLLATIL
jgi:polysaccharide pyruvyl transferase WcaK-like protein